jgi:hypothetical protein
VGYLFIGPLAETIGTPTALMASGALNMVVCFLVLLAPSVRSIRMGSEAASPGAPQAPIEVVQADLVGAGDEGG